MSVGSDPEVERPAAPPSLRETSARGFAWTGGQALINRGLSLVGFIVLARLLDPHAYGVVALATVFIALLAILAAGGFGQAIVQIPEVDRHDLDTVFWISMGMGVSLTILLVAAAGPLAAAFDMADLGPVLQVLAVSFVVVGVGSVPFGLLQRRMEFKALAQASIIANVVATVAGIAFAFAGAGVWSLVVQTLVALVLLNGAVVVMSRFRPGLQVSRAAFTKVFATSRYFLGTALTTFFTTRTDDFLIGSVLGSVVLGVYAVAYRILTVLIEVLTTTVRQVAFPTFSRLQSDRTRLERAYRSAVAMCVVTAFPVYAFCLVAAADLVRVVFGSQWMASVPVLRVLCLYGMLNAVMTFNAALLQSVGRARLVFRFSVVQTVLRVAGFAIAVPYGIVWVAGAHVIVGYALSPVLLVAATRELDVRFAATLSGLLGTVVAVATMAGAVLLVDAALAGVSPLVRLMAEGTVATLVYVPTLRLVDRRTFDEAVQYVGAITGRRRGRPPALEAR